MKRRGDEQREKVNLAHWGRGAATKKAPSNSTQHCLSGVAVDHMLCKKSVILQVRPIAGLPASVSWKSRLIRGGDCTASLLL